MEVVIVQAHGRSSVRTALRRMALLTALAPLVGAVAGCSSGDNPRIVEVPEFKGKPDTAPPVIPGRTVKYGASKKYQDAMNK